MSTIEFIFLTTKTMFYCFNSFILYVMYKMMLIIHVSIASTKRRLSELKIIKTYLRSTMS